MKKSFKLFIIVGLMIIVCGCSNKILTVNDNIIYTTVYPVEFLTNSLYGDNMPVSSIFPDGSNPLEYKLTSKQIKDYSKGSVFVYNGLTDEKKIARKLINKNKSIKIIDFSFGLSLENGPEELWLSPSNYLMLSATVKDSLEELLNSKVANELIEKNYEELQTKISQMDAELRIISANVNNPTLVVDSNIFKFLEKYGYKVISLEDEDNLTPNSLATIQNEFKDGVYKYILIRDDTDLIAPVSNLVDNYKAQTISMNIMSTIKEDDRKANEDYYTLLQENIDNIRNVVIGK